LYGTRLGDRGLGQRGHRHVGIEVELFERIAAQLAEPARNRPTRTQDGLPTRRRSNCLNDLRDAGTCDERLVECPAVGGANARNLTGAADLSHDLGSSGYV
jgi:hypothetical protein